MDFDEDKLISIVRKYPELYAINDRHYMNTKKKNKIWREIAHEMKVRDNVVKMKWKMLRDGFHRYTKRVSSGEDDTKLKKWKYAYEMEFLRPYLSSRAKSNIEGVESVSDSGFNIKSESYSDRTMSPDPVDSSSSSDMSLKKRKKKQNQTQLTENVMETTALQDCLDETPTAIDSWSPVHSFFKAMADTLITLPVDLQLRVKNKVYAIVSDAESENLARNIID